MTLNDFIKNREEITYYEFCEQTEKLVRSGRNGKGLKFEKNHGEYHGVYVWIDGEIYVHENYYTYDTADDGTHIDGRYASESYKGDCPLNDFLVYLIADNNRPLM